MPRALRIVVVAAALLLAVPAIVAAAPDGAATVAFGQPDHGSPFPPPEHDASFNAKDNLVPRNVVISRPGNVTYVITAAPDGGPHQPAIYRPGTTPADVAILGPGPFVNDPDGRVALGPLVGAGSVTWSPAAGTFSEPGSYLVICNFMPHFSFARMFGWVQVK